MADLKNRIRQLLEQVENQAIEFKRAAISAQDFAKESVAFANSEGGEILIDVEDDGAISGISDEVASDTWAISIARDSVIPAIQIEATLVEFEGKKVLLVQVPKGKDKPCQTNQNRYLIRVGSANRNATQQGLLKLFQQSGVFHFDATAVEKSGLVSLNFPKLNTYFQKHNIDFSNDPEKELLLKNTEVMTSDGRVTVGGLLIFGANPQRFLPNACIAFAHFKGNEISDELIDRQEITGTLDHQVDAAMAVVKNNIRMPSRIVEAPTEATRFMYPDKVFRELLANAVIHRNYAIRGSRIRIFLFDDRIEFRSPGKLPNTVTLAKITRGVSYAVNPILLKFMQNKHYVDKLGRGIPMVYQTAISNGKRVDFEEIGEEFIVTLWF